LKFCSFLKADCALRHNLVSCGQFMAGANTVNKKTQSSIVLGLSLASSLAALVVWRRSRQVLPSGAADKRGIAVVTGASSGIGEAFARRLAREGYDLLLIARRRERLETLAAQLRQRHDVAVDVMSADLAQPADIERAAQHIGRLDHLTLLVNNAGFGTVGQFAQTDIGGQVGMIQVHVLAPVCLARAALPQLIRRQGALVNVSSISAFMPFGGSVVYSAVKAFLNKFTLTLREELRGTGVRVQAVCPGFTLTEFHDALGGRPPIPAPLWMSAEAVVDCSLRDLARGRVICVPGVLNQAIVLMAQVLPRPLFRVGNKAIRLVANIGLFGH
jgi:hypothetical protein